MNYFHTIARNTDEVLAQMLNKLNGEINAMREFEAKLNSDLTEYNKTTRAAFNELQAQMMVICNGDWRGYTLKTSKKSELRQSMLTVISRSIEGCAEWISKIQAEVDHRDQVAKAKAESQVIREWFYAKVFPQKDDYIRGFDKISEGIRQWNCLEALCLTGKVTADNIAEYGIEI